MMARLPIDSARVHNNGPGAVSRGEMVGAAGRDFYENGHRRIDLEMVGLTLTGTTFVAEYNGPIVRDATNAFGSTLNASFALDGFEWLDNGTLIKINALTYAGWKITGTLNSAPVGTLGQQVLRYGEQDAASTGTWPNQVPGGVVRSTDPGWPSPRDPTVTHYRFAIPQSITPRAA